MIVSPIDLKNLVLGDFTPLLGARFEVSLNEGEAVVNELTLREASGIGSQRQGSRAAFSLIFTGPNEVRMSQGVYWLSNPVIGPLPIFLVPVGEDAEYRLYEAVFN